MQEANRNKYFSISFPSNMTLFEIQEGCQEKSSYCQLSRNGYVAGYLHTALG